MGIVADKVILITGAGAGLGRAYAEYLAAHGASLLINEISEESAERLRTDFAPYRHRVRVTVGDVGDWQYTQSMVNECVEHFTRIDGLVNNAGTYYYAKAWEEDDEHRLRNMYSANVLGALYCGVHAMRPMIASGSGAIVNVTSGAHIGIPGLTAYGGTKGAIASLTYGWALELREHGVRVNAVSPRARTKDSPGRPDDRTGALWSAEHAAPLVAYLLSDLSRDITGQVVRLSGTELSLMSHPWEAAQTVSSQTWPFEKVADAFETAFRACLRPVGLKAPTNALLASR